MFSVLAGILGGLSVNLIKSNNSFAYKYNVAIGNSFGHFWNMSSYDDSRAVWVVFKKETISESQRYLKNSAPTLQYLDLV